MVSAALKLGFGKKKIYESSRFISFVAHDNSLLGIGRAHVKRSTRSKSWTGSKTFTEDQPNSKSHSSLSPLSQKLLSRGILQLEHRPPAQLRHRISKLADHEHDADKLMTRPRLKALTPTVLSTRHCRFNCLRGFVTATKQDPWSESATMSSRLLRQIPSVWNSPQMWSVRWDEAS